MPNSNFDSRFVIQDEMRVVMSGTNQLSSYKTFNAKQLKSDPFILSSSGCAPLIQSIFDEHDLIPNISYTVGSLPTILEMVKESIGITILPSLALENIKSSTIVHRPLKPSHYRDIGLGTSYSFDNDITLSTFHEICLSTVQSLK